MLALSVLFFTTLLFFTSPVRQRVSRDVEAKNPHPNHSASMETDQVEAAANAEHAAKQVQEEGEIGEEKPSGASESFASSNVTIYGRIFCAKLTEVPSPTFHPGSRTMHFEGKQRANVPNRRHRRFATSNLNDLYDAHGYSSYVGGGAPSSRSDPSTWDGASQEGPFGALPSDWFNSEGYNPLLLAAQPLYSLHSKDSTGVGVQQTQRTEGYGLPSSAGLTPTGGYYHQSGSAVSPAIPIGYQAYPATSGGPDWGVHSQVYEHTGAPPYPSSNAYGNHGLRSEMDFMQVSDSEELGTGYDEAMGPQFGPSLPLPQQFSASMMGSQAPGDFPAAPQPPFLQQHGSLPPTTISEKLQWEQTPPSEGSFIAAGEGLTRMERMELPSNAQPFDKEAERLENILLGNGGGGEENAQWGFLRRQRRGAPNHNSATNYDIQLVPASDVLVSVYRSGQRPYELPQLVKELQIDEEGYFALTISDDDFHNLHPYLIVSHHCSPIEQPGGDKVPPHNYTDYFPIADTIRGSHDESVWKVLVIGIGDWEHIY